MLISKKSSTWCLHMVEFSQPVALILMNVPMKKMSVVLMQPVKILNHRTLANVLKDNVLILKSHDFARKLAKTKKLIG